MQRAIAIPLPLAALCLLLASAACAGLGAWGPYRGRVIDAETKEPIEGAVVLAVWWRAVHGGPGAPVEYFEDAAETLTNAQGEFEIPAKVLGTIAPLTEIRKPRFTIFKPGYRKFPRYPGAPPYGIGATAPGEEGLVELQRLSSTEDRLANLGGLAVRVPFSKIPLLVKAVNEELRALGFKPEYGRE